MSSRITFSPAILALIAGLEKLPASFKLRRTQYQQDDNDKPTRRVQTRGMIWFTNRKAEACEVFKTRECLPGTVCLLESVAFHKLKDAQSYSNAGQSLGLTDKEIGMVVDVADSGRAGVASQSQKNRALYRAFNGALRRRAERLNIPYVA